MTVKDVANLFTSTVVCCLVSNGSVRLAIRILFPWSIIDCFLVHRFPPPDVDFRNSLIVHHIVVCVLCSQYELYDAVGSHQWIEAILLLEFSTPFVCLHNVLKTHTTRCLRTVAWIVVRGVVSTYLLYHMHRSFPHDEYVRCSSPYVVALVLLSISWTFRSLPHVSALSLVLVPYTAYRRGLPLTRWLIPTFQVPVSLAFHNCNQRDADFWRNVDHASIALSVLVLYENCHVVSAAICVAFSVWAETIPHIANLICAYEILKVPSAERVVLGMLMGIYVVFHGPRNLSFGHKIAWHTICTSVFMRCLEDGLGGGTRE